MAEVAGVGLAEEDVLLTTGAVLVGVNFPGSFFVAVEEEEDFNSSSFDERILAVKAFVILSDAFKSSILRSSS